LFDGFCGKSTGFGGAIGFDYAGTY